MRATRISILKLAKDFELEAVKAEAGNKSAGVRARKLSLEIGNLLKQYRKESTK